MWWTFAGLVFLPVACFWDHDNDGYLASRDCDDRNPAIHPGAREVCDSGIDNDCDGFADAADTGLALGTTVIVFPDQDGDGFGLAAGRTRECAGPGKVYESGDCDDSNPNVRPGALEVCDGIDNDCDPTTLERGVTFISADGTVTDYTSVLESLGEEDPPLDFTMDEAGILYLCSGVWPLSLDIRADVSVVGVNGSAHTIIDGRRLRPAVLISSPDREPTLTIEGVQLIRGAPVGEDGAFGGGLHCNGPAEVFATDLTIQFLDPANLGPALFARSGCAITLRDSLLQGALDPDSGGIPAEAGGLVWFDEGSATFHNTRFVGGRGFSSEGGGSSGGGMVVNLQAYLPSEKRTFAETHVTCTDCVFEDNVADLTGALIVGPNTTFQMVGGGFFRNRALFGPAVFLRSGGDGAGFGSARLELKGVVFEDNQVSTDPSLGESVFILTAPGQIGREFQTVCDFESAGPQTVTCDDLVGCSVCPSP